VRRGTRARTRIVVVVRHLASHLVLPPSPSPPLFHTRRLEKGGRRLRAMWLVVNDDYDYDDPPRSGMGHQHTHIYAYRDTICARTSFLGTCEKHVGNAAETTRAGRQRLQQNCHLRNHSEEKIAHELGRNHLKGACERPSLRVRVRQPVPGGAVAGRQVGGNRRAGRRRREGVWKELVAGVGNSAAASTTRRRGNTRRRRRRRRGGARARASRRRNSFPTTPPTDGSQSHFSRFSTVDRVESQSSVVEARSLSIGHFFKHVIIGELSFNFANER